MKRNHELVESYRRLFYLTGQPVFFMAYRTMEKTSTPILLPPLEKEQEDNLTL